MDAETLKNRNFWNHIGAQKSFNDPFFIEKFFSHVSKDKLIIEYGCGYGRILNKLWEAGYKNTIGFDFSSEMVKRGQALFPELNLQVFSTSLPLADHSVDGAILSTVLCSNHLHSVQEKIIAEISRVLKPRGVLYLCDFLITRSERYLSLYSKNEDYGVYQTSGGLFVRHHNLHWIFHLLQKFEIMWLEQMDGETMNGHPVRTVHLIAEKS